VGAFSDAYTMLALLMTSSVAQNFFTMGFSTRARMVGGGEGSGYGGIFHGGGRIYYQSASNDIQKRVDTAGTYQDLMAGTPVPPGVPTFDAPAYNKPYNVSEWQMYRMEGIYYYRMNNTDGTCTGVLTTNRGDPFISASTPYHATGKNTTVELDDADPDEVAGSPDMVSRVSASLYNFSQTCGPMYGSFESALAARADGTPLRRSSSVARRYNNHQDSQAWSISRYTDARSSNSSTFYEAVNMDWVAYDIRDKFEVPAACPTMKALLGGGPPINCVATGVTCTGDAANYPLNQHPACLAQFFPEGAPFPNVPASNVAK